MLTEAQIGGLTMPGGVNIGGFTATENRGTLAMVAAIGMLGTLTGDIPNPSWGTAAMLVPGALLSPPAAWALPFATNVPIPPAGPAGPGSPASVGGAVTAVALCWLVVSDCKAVWIVLSSEPTKPRIMASSAVWTDYSSLSLELADAVGVPLDVPAVGSCLLLPPSM